MSHVAITVADLDAALEWYATVSASRRESLSRSSVDASDGAMMRDMLGPAFGRIRYAIVSTGSGVFLEIFESVEPPTEPAPSPRSSGAPGPGKR